MKQEKVAVLMSTYNGSAYIEEQIASLQAQIIDRQFDIHIRDDGSTDGTKTTLEKLAHENSNIFFYDEPNVGVVDSFLWLAKNIEGYDYYAFCDQDDYWQSLKLLAGVTLIDQMSKGKPSVYCSAYEYVDQNLKHIGRFVSKSDFSINNLLIENCAPGCTMVFNEALRNKFCEIKTANVSRRVVMHDWLFILLAAYHGEIIYDSNSYLLYRQHANNVIGKKSGFLSIIKSKIKQFKREIKRPQHLLYLQTQLLSEITANDPTSEMHRLSNSFIRSQKTFISRVKFICKGEIKRVKKIDDVIFKILYIFGYYK
ncbi:glycosyltransferase [Enterobacter hormaechei]|uniref:glycosyltransferase n=1 Tax=Enterobacter hormaechei TaxID=158836 RepID=UPI000791CB05|nr:glycosyltransferase [Enterobacter hormaechei]MBY4583725.1 glycosyltransferase [Enterobacter hormaechei]OUK78906.1 glycosyl transferase 2 family protein [Enterobacter hormaechei]RTP60387.1 glycosyltransferase [Enterobacter hormaechei]SAI38883.1 putative glycosyl transferase [Enterobacter hormaechei]VAF60570.1 putative glycosyl transferase [Enterobacter hormaechei]